MDEKRKGKLISFSIAGREEELDRVGDRGRGRHNYFLDLRQSELGHIVSQPLVVVQHQHLQPHVSDEDVHLEAGDHVEAEVEADEARKVLEHPAPDPEVKF